MPNKGLEMIKELTQMVQYTPTQLRLLQVLSDGQRHTLYELHKCLDDELATVNAVNSHLKLLRRKLEPQGQSILCESTGKQFFYRHVRLLANPYDGRS